MPELSSLGSVIREALMGLSGSQKLPPDAIDGLTEQIGNLISAVNQATALAQGAVGNAMPDRGGVPAEYVLTAARTYVPQGLAAPSEIRNALEALGEDDRMSAAMLRPEPGHSLVQIDTSGLVEGTTFTLRLDSSTGNAVLTTGEPAEIDPDLPARPVVGTNFVALAYSAQDGAIDINVTAYPASAQPILRTEVQIEGLATPISIPADAAMPYELAYSPVSESDADAGPSSTWQFGVPTFNKRFRLRMVSAGGTGVPSAWQTVTIDQSTTYFVTDDDWTFDEDRASSASADGLSITTIQPSRVVPAGWDLQLYTGTQPWSAANEVAIAAAAIPITPGTSKQSTTGAAIGSDLYAILLMKGPGMARGRKASNQRRVTVRGRQEVGAPTVSVNPSLSGTGKIGSALSLAYGTWLGADTMQQQVLRDGVAIDGATGTSYTPVAADDQRKISVRVRGTASGGAFTERTTAEKAISYPVPTVGTALSSQSFSQQSGAYRSIDISGVFAGAGYTVTVEGPSVGGVPVCSVNMTDMTLGVAVSSVLAATNIKLKATNSGGSVESAFSLTITATGTASVPKLVTPVGGSNSSGLVAYTNYKAGDMILAGVVVYSGSGFTKPDLAAWSGDYDWNQIVYVTGTGMSAGLYYRRANGNGNDGTLGDWGNGRPTYWTVENVDWSDPIGAATGALKVAGVNLDHPALTIEGANSVVFDIAFMASAQAGQLPGLRPGAVEVASSATGVRKLLSQSAISPVTSWPAADDVPHAVNSTNSSGVQFVGAVEVKGSSGAATIEAPAPVAQEKISITEVTDPAVATANGFSGISGRMKTVLASDLALTATTSSGNWTLVFEIGDNEIPAPANTGKTFVSGTYTYYTISSIQTGRYLYRRVWWRMGTGASAVFRLAWSDTPFVVQGLTSSPPGTTTWPALYGIGTGIGELKSKIGAEDFYMLPQYKAELGVMAGYDTTKRIGQRGEGFTPAAYCSWRGDTSFDAMTLAFIRGGLLKGKEVTAQGGYAAQHDLQWLGAVYFARNTPRVWNELTSTEKTYVLLIVEASAVGNAGTTREDGENMKTMLGSSNSSTTIANPNIGSASRACVVVCAAIMGAATLDTYFKEITEAKMTDIYNRLVAAGNTNTAMSFNPTRPSGSPTFKQIVAKLSKGWTSRGKTLLQGNDLVAVENNFAHSKTCKTKVPSRVGSGAGRYQGVGQILGTASAALTALVGQVGMSLEFEGFDTANNQGTGDRSSAEYGMKALRVMVVLNLVALASGFVSKSNATYKASYDKFKVCTNFFREITKNSVGWDSYAQADTKMSGPWTWADMNPGSGRENWGILPYYAMCDAVISFVDGGAIPDAYKTSAYFTTA